MNAGWWIGWTIGVISAILISRTEGVQPVTVFILTFVLSLGSAKIGELMWDKR